MSEYKCISCGNTRDIEKPCTCPDCGYRMFPTPYDRRQMLIQEINGFVAKLVTVTIQDNDIAFSRKVIKQVKNSSTPQVEVIYKSADEKRFPGFDKIQSYVCSSRKTEEFFARLAQSVGEIREHIHASYQQKYESDDHAVKLCMEKRDAVVLETMAAMNLACDLPEINLPVISLDYREAPNPELVEEADELLSRLEELAEKTRRFIRINNIYGTAYQKKHRPRLKKEKEASDLEKMDYAAAVVKKAIQKRYEVDIFSDGTDELDEMLTALWTGISAVMTLPVLKRTERYCLGDDQWVEQKDCMCRLSELCSEHYGKIPDPVLDEQKAADYSDEQLFELYNQLIDLDSLGYLGINKSGLIRIGESERELNELIGLAGIKDSVRKIKAYALANKGSEALNLHMCFYGNPGTGKTEVARIIAGILYENKILPTKKLIEVDRGGLVGQYVGETPQKTMSVIQRAMGGVLFIDEAYALVPRDGGGWDYGHEAIATLIKAMEDYRGKFCVILAGYRNQMHEMIAANPGFQSRIQFELDFPNYSRGELAQITELMLRKRKYTMVDSAMEKLLDITDVSRKDPNFANARQIRNMLDQVVMCQNVRAAGTEDRELGLVDVNQYIRDAGIVLPSSGEGKSAKIMTGEEELDRLIGLTTIKRMVRKIKAYAKKNASDRGFNLHMCFLGNPGTGKTEVARILSRILYDAGVLKESKLVETDSTGLLGQYVGETGPKTQRIIRDAMGGVLFIDEAYALCAGNSASGSATNYGDEALAVLLKEMEDHRGQFCVILAGYKDEMNKMVGANPGFKSRIQFTLEFPDYSREELGEIAVSFLSAKNYTIDDAALNKLLDVTEYYRQHPNFANARTVRSIVDQVIMNQNLRAEDNDEDFQIIESDVNDYIMDEGIDLTEAAPRRRIGF